MVNATTPAAHTCSWLLVVAMGAVAGRDTQSGEPDCMQTGRSCRSSNTHAACDMLVAHVPALVIAGYPSSIGGHVPGDFRCRSLQQVLAYNQSDALVRGWRDQSC